MKATIWRGIMRPAKIAQNQPGADLGAARRAMVIELYLSRLISRYGLLMGLKQPKCSGVSIHTNGQLALSRLLRRPSDWRLPCKHEQARAIARNSIFGTQDRKFLPDNVRSLASYRNGEHLASTLEWSVRGGRLDVRVAASV